MRDKQPAEGCFCICLREAGVVVRVAFSASSCDIGKLMVLVRHQFSALYQAKSMSSPVLRGWHPSIHADQA